MSSLRSSNMRERSGNEHWCCMIMHILLVDIVAIVLVLQSFIIIMPSFSITKFYLPALNKTYDNYNNGSSQINLLNQTLHFTAEFKNKMMFTNVKFGDLQFNFFYGSSPIGNATLAGFILPGWYKKRSKEGIAYTHGEVVSATASNHAVFRVDLITRVKYNNYFWYGKGHDFVRNTRVEVDGNSNKIWVGGAL
ncbi:unnamed protein product [Cuscuta epithymum]|uniref:Late embryogenesis abundant protein LEA-2 subgroup domain-containing protein n=1 Tax=Cuscuta epithymum TaxID=186058 RepID=A0AAV0G1P0_9ASTE|nr:unnamed protein product [Cuscuta epithymum]